MNFSTAQEFLSVSVSMTVRELRAFKALHQISMTGAVTKANLLAALTGYCEAVEAPAPVASTVPAFHASRRLQRPLRRAVKLALALALAPAPAPTAVCLNPAPQNTLIPPMGIIPLALCGGVWLVVVGIQWICSEWGALVLAVAAAVTYLRSLVGPVARLSARAWCLGRRCRRFISGPFMAASRAWERIADWAAASYALVTMY